jgi:hypothetical protein
VKFLEDALGKGGMEKYGDALIVEEWCAWIGRPLMRGKVEWPDAGGAERGKMRISSCDKVVVLFGSLLVLWGYE